MQECSATPIIGLSSINYTPIFIVFLIILILILIIQLLLKSLDEDEETQI